MQLQVHRMQVKPPHEALLIMKGHRKTEGGLCDTLAHFVISFVSGYYNKEMRGGTRSNLYATQSALIFLAMQFNKHLHTYIDISGE